MKAAGRYAIAIASIAVAVALTIALSELLAPMRLFFLWCAVLFTAVVAGVGPALAALVCALFAAAFFIFDPVGSLAVHSGMDLVRLALFAAFATGLTLAVGMRRRAVERAERLAEQVRESELRYRTLVEATPLPQAVWTASADGRIEWSDQWSVITGQSREDLEAGGGMRAVHPEDAARTIERWSTAVGSATMYEDEIRVRVRDRGYRWFAIKAAPVIDNDRVLEWVGIVVNVDDRRRHQENTTFINRASDVLASSLGYEETLRNLARLCVPTVGDACGIDIGSGAGYERLVVEHVDPVLGQRLRELDRLRPVPELDPSVQAMTSGQTQIVENLTDDMLRAIAPSEESLRGVMSLGLRSWIVAPMIARGRTLGALTVACGAGSGRQYTQEDVPLIEDLARRAAVAIDNSRLYEAAEAANRAKDEFLATLSHELRTPLTAISGWAHMLQLGTDEATTELAIDTIVRSAKAQGELIDDLLDLSRVVAGTLHLNVATIEIGPVLEEVVVAARPAAEAKALALELAPVPLVLVRADERRLRQVIWNLVTNAIKFTESGGSVRIELSAVNGRARVAVTDTGRGIDPQFLPYVWDRFRQADSSSSRQHGGLGLGLAVVRHLVELHGGTVSVASAGLRQGACFAFELPLARLGVANAAAAQAANPDKPLAARQVLVVEDDHDARVVIATMLRQAGADVTATASVDEARGILATQRIDVVVSDIAMPGEDGYSLARYVHDTLRVPVIAVSAMATGSDDRQIALDAGFTEFVRKPVDPRTLANVVAAALQR